MEPIKTGKIRAYKNFPALEKEMFLELLNRICFCPRIERQPAAPRRLEDLAMLKM